MDDLESRIAEDIRLRGMSDKTLERYLAAVAAYRAFLGGGRLEDAGEEEMRAYSRHLREERGARLDASHNNSDS